MEMMTDKIEMLKDLVCLIERIEISVSLLLRTLRERRNYVRDVVVLPLYIGKCIIPRFDLKVSFPSNILMHLKFSRIFLPDPDISLRLISYRFYMIYQLQNEC